MTYEFLYQKYIVENLTSRQIADLLGISKNPILRELKKYGLTRKGKHSRIGRAIKSRKYIVGSITQNFWTNFLSQAKTRNIEVNITPEYIWNLYVQQNAKCNLTKLDLNLDKYISSVEGRKNVVASLDRIDSSKGYIEGNIQWVHKLVNRMKMDINQNDFINICKLIVENIK